jgi:hypothetical protein
VTLTPYLWLRSGGGSAEIELRSGLSEHLERVCRGDVHGETGVRDKHSCASVGLRAFMRNDNVLMLTGIGDQEIVGIVPGEVGKRCLCEVPRVRPGGEFREVARCVLVDGMEERSVRSSPVGDLVVSLEQLVKDSVDSSRY